MLELLYNKIKNTLRKIDMKIERAKYGYIEKLPKDINYFDGGMYDAVYEASCKWPHNIALEYYGAQVSYKELIKKINKVASALKAIGAEKGEYISVCMPNTPESVYTFYAINEIGAVANMIHPLSSEMEIEDHLNQAHSRIMLCIDIAYPKVEAIIKNTELEKVVVVSATRSMDFIVDAIYRISKGRKNHIKKSQQITTWGRFLSKASKYIGNPHARVNSKDEAVVLYSGGTTGKPKGVVLTNLNFNALALGAKYLVPELLKTEYGFLTFLPNFHAFGLGCCIHMPLYFGMRVVLIPQFNPKKVRKYIKKYKINIFVGVPTVFEHIMRVKFRKKELKNIKYVVSGGDIISMSMKEKINDFLKAHGSSAIVENGYGLTEATGGFIFSPQKVAEEANGIGYPIPDNEVIIVSPKTKKEVPVGEDGEIVVRGLSVMKGYLGKPKETAEAFVTVHGKKYLRTGDIGYVDEHGLFHFRLRWLVGIVMFLVSLLALYAFDSVPFRILFCLFAVVSAIELLSFFHKKFTISNALFAIAEIGFLIGSVVFVTKTDLVDFWYIILGVCGYDIFAYLFGRAFGGKIFPRSRPFPRISKNKTWEGTILGLLASAAMVAGLMSVRGAFGADSVYLLCGPLALVGDLYESFLKRRFGVKDSNEIVIRNKIFAKLELAVGGSEGHGGFLDRIDSTAFATTVLLIISLLA